MSEYIYTPPFIAILKFCTALKAIDHFGRSPTALQFSEITRYGVFGAKILSRTQKLV